MDPLTGFHPATAEWFQRRFGTPTAVQSASWPLIRSGEHLLATAPTGSGKTLTAFLAALDAFRTGAFEPGATRVLYVSPLKALNNDIQRNLLDPLAELTAEYGMPPLRIAVRSGDTEPGERQRLLRQPPDILIITPESLQLMLTTRKGQLALVTVATVIVDEIHALASSRRGVMLMTALERLVELAGEFQRIALSATVRPLTAIAEYLGGTDAAGRPRPVNLVAPTVDKPLSLSLRYPEAARDAADNGQPIWEALAACCREIAERNRSTLIFANSRALTEKLTLLINRTAGHRLAYAHHGSLAREIRFEVERRLKAGELKAIVATSSLEMGIDIGALDEVVLIQSPGTVASALQRIGRAGHQVGAASRGTLFPTHAQDILAGAALSAAVAERDIEPLTPLTGPLDVLAQVILSACAVEPRRVDDLFALLQRSGPYRKLERRQFDLVIDMLAGRYQGTRIRELKPRIQFDRLAGTVRTERHALLTLYSSGGTIPDRGYYQLRLADTGERIGELDEEFVWEARIGQHFAFGTQHWRVERITHNDVLVSPGAPETAAPPFWRSETQNRHPHFADRVGALLARIENVLATEAATPLAEMLQAEFHMDATAAQCLIDYCQRQREATGTALPHQDHLLLERITAGPGGYQGPDQPQQLVLHSCAGGMVNRPWALALGAALARETGRQPELFVDDNAIVLMHKALPDAADLLQLVTPDNLVALLREALEGSGFFGARFRECAGRALLLPRARFNQRLPLWMSRLQAKKLMSQIAELPDFPILLETWRTCLQDEFDLPALTQKLTALETGTLTWTPVTSRQPSPFAANVAFDQITPYMYGDDTPERQNPSALDDDLIKATVAEQSLRPRLLQEVVDAFVMKRQRRLPEYRPEDEPDWAEWVKERVLIPAAEFDGPTELAQLCWLQLGERRWAVHRENLGALLQTSLVPAEATAEAAVFWDDPRDAQALALEILSFYGPLTAAEIHRLLPTVPPDLLQGQELVQGPLTEHATATQWCDTENYERLLRLQRQARRPQLEPRPVQALPAFLSRWQQFHRTASVAAVADALEQLRGFPAPLALWLEDIWLARFPGFQSSDLDDALAETLLEWRGVGREAITFDDPALPLRDDVPGADAAFTGLFADPSAGYRFSQLASRSGETITQFNERWWQMVWSGALTSEGLQALRLGRDRQFQLADTRTLARRRRGPGAGGFDWPGRWQLRSVPAPATDPLEQLENAKERARALLARYGVVCRELVTREGLTWRPLFRALRLMELGGEVLAGYFFQALSGPQFLLPRALPLLQADPAAAGDFWVTAQDPVAPTGLGIDWPELPVRRPGNALAFLAGELQLVVTGGGRRLHFLLQPDDPRCPRTLPLLTHLRDRSRRLTIEQINGVDARTSPYRVVLAQAFEIHSDHRQLMLETF